MEGETASSVARCACYGGQVSPLGKELSPRQLKRLTFGPTRISDAPNEWLQRRQPLGKELSPRQLKRLTFGPTRISDAPNEWLQRRQPLGRHIR